MWETSQEIEMIMSSFERSSICNLSPNQKDIVRKILIELKNAIWEWKPVEGSLIKDRFSSNKNKEMYVVSNIRYDLLYANRAILKKDKLTIKIGKTLFDICTEYSKEYLKENENWEIELMMFVVNKSITLTTSEKENLTSILETIKTKLSKNEKIDGSVIKEHLYNELNDKYGNEENELKKVEDIQGLLRARCIHNNSELPTIKNFYEACDDYIKKYYEKKNGRGIWSLDLKSSTEEWLKSIWPLSYESPY